MTYSSPVNEHWYVAAEESILHTTLLMGPFRNHSEAAPWVDKVRQAIAPFLIGREWFANFGVARVIATDPQPGRFNGLALFVS